MSGDVRVDLMAKPFAEGMRFMVRRVAQADGKVTKREALHWETGEWCEWGLDQAQPPPDGTELLRGMQGDDSPSGVLATVEVSNGGE